jgi:hypothetical protein
MRKNGAKAEKVHPILLYISALMIVKLTNNKKTIIVGNVCD